MNSRFKTLYGKPKTLSDRHHEISAEEAAELLRKPEAELGCDDFYVLFQASTAAASYEEGVYFLPEAFAFLRRNPNEDGVECVADVIWFISEYAERLHRDGLLDECREQIRTLLAEQTREFVILPWDQATNPEPRETQDHCENLKNSPLVEGTLEALLRFGRLGTWAEEFLATLLIAQEEPVKSAWFLALAGPASCWILFQGCFGGSAETPLVEAQTESMPSLAAIWNEWERRAAVQKHPAQWTSESALLKYHAGVIRKSGDLFTLDPTYWAGLLRTLGLAESTSPEQPSTPRVAVAEPEISLMTPRDQLIQDIEAAFHSVERGNGLTLHEAAKFEGTDYCSAEERACVRALDPETRWQDIPDSALEDCEDRWGFDEEGFSFHLPAYMRWHLRQPPGPDSLRGGMLYYQLSMNHEEEKRVFWELDWDTYTLEQKRVIARFLEFTTRKAGQHAQDARQAWRSYWHKFSQPM